MKKLFFTATVSLIGLAFFNPADAQMLALKKVNPAIENSHLMTEKVFESVKDVRTVELRDPRIIKHFTKNFIDAANVNWYIVDNGMIAKFKKDHLPYAITYSQDGSWKHTIKYYAAQYVPEDVKRKVTKHFKDFAIIRAREVQLPSQQYPVFLVQIQKGNEVKTVSSSKGGMKVLESMKLLNSDPIQ